MHFLALVVALAATFNVAVASPSYLVDTYYTDSACTTKQGGAEYIQFGVCVPQSFTGTYMYSYVSDKSYSSKYYSDASCKDVTSQETLTLTTCTDKIVQSMVNAPTYGKAYSKVTYTDNASCKARTASNIVSIEAYDTFTSSCNGNNMMSQAVISCSGTSVIEATYSGSPMCSVKSVELKEDSCGDGTVAYECPGDDGDSDKAACFAGSETVMLESGTTKLISDVSVGDRILAADMNGVTVFSSVVALAHPKNSIAATFVHIETASIDIKVTADHLLLASADCTKAKLMKATDIAVGSCLLTVDGGERVEAISTTVENGIYSVITQEEMIVVNGVIASPFAVNHQAASRYYDIHRAFMTVFPAVLGFKVFESLHFGVSAFIGSYV